MRIALIVPGGVGRDGIRHVIPALLDLIARLARRHDVLVVALNQSPLPDSYRLFGAHVICPGYGKGMVARLGRVLAVISAFRPQVLHSFWFGATSLCGALAARFLGVPLVAHLGGGELVDLPAIAYGGRRSARMRLYTTLTLRTAQVVSAGSHYALTPLLARRPDARWLPLGVEVSKYCEIGRHDAARLLQVASVNRVKGPEVMLAALDTARRLRPHPAPVLDWIGEDTLAGRVQMQAAALGLHDAAHFHGWQPHHDLPARQAAATLYVQSSHHESQGVAVLEAAAAGLPLVGTAVGLLAELAPAAATVVAPGDGPALGTAIAAALTEQERMRRQAAAARAWAADHDADWTAREFEAIYAEVRLKGGR